MRAHFLDPMTTDLTEKGSIYRKIESKNHASGVYGEWALSENINTFILNYQ